MIQLIFHHKKLMRQLYYRSHRLSGSRCRTIHQANRGLCGHKTSHVNHANHLHRVYGWYNYLLGNTGWWIWTDYLSLLAIYWLRGSLLALWPFWTNKWHFVCMTLCDPIQLRDKLIRLSQTIYYNCITSYTLKNTHKTQVIHIFTQATAPDVALPGTPRRQTRPFAGTGAGFGGDCGLSQAHTAHTQVRHRL